ncbi:tape measure protein [Peptostreptococcus equinus]|uniref:Tape measure protein n=1 Tax=Peptostreptococcus equinus TaxID=3003601 RepID=A0ABY7JU91_9FIRM|nr:tape measure protein [Peptostreptococcus sp. CBA3647]WAW15292.1 tape measure protein [Peptostreptococcus sp. CBA3647]
MAISTRELKGRIKVENNVEKEFKKMSRELKNFKKETKDVDKELNKNRKFKMDANEAKKGVKDVGDKIKETDNLSKKGIRMHIKDLASSGIEAIKGKLQGMGKLGEIGIKILGKAPALAVIAGIGFGLGKLVKSAYNGVKVWINDATQWTLQKIQNGLAMLKDKVIKVTIEGYNEYSDYKSRAKSIKKGMSYKEYDKLMQSTASDTRGSLKDTRAGVTKLMQMAPDTFGGDAKSAAKFYKTAMQSFRIGGASSEEASSAMYQMNQGLASGALQGDELRSVRENAPLMAKMIEKELGMGIKKAGEQGLVTAEVVKRALENNAKEINEQYKNIPLNFKDMWVMAGSFMEANVFTPLYERMQGVFENPALQNFFKNLYSDAESFMKSFWELMDQTNFGGIDFSILWDSLSPIRDLFNDIFDSITNKSPGAVSSINDFGAFVNRTFEGMEPVMELFSDIARDIFDFLKEHPDFAKKALAALASSWRKDWADMKLKLELADKVILPILTEFNNAITAVETAVTSLMTSWNTAFNNMKKQNMESAVGGVLNFTGGGSGNSGYVRPPDGKGVNRAMGQARVPYDNFPANLHQGERVLSKREANEYDKKSSNSAGVVFNIFGLTVREQADIDLIADRFVKKMNLSLEGGV